MNYAIKTEQNIIRKITSKVGRFTFESVNTNNTDFKFHIFDTGEKNSYFNSSSINDLELIDLHNLRELINNAIDNTKK